MALTRLQPAALQPSAFSGLNITDGSLYPVDLSSGAPVWDVSGNLGVGTGSPSVKLHLSTTSSSGSAAMFIDSPSASGVGSYISLRKAGSARLLIGVDSSISGTGDDAAIYTYGANATKFYNNGNVSMTLGASGNLGVGVTPSAWQASSKAYELGSAGTGQAAIAITASGYMDIMRNAYVATGGVSTYKYTSYATMYRQDPTGQHIWYNAPSGTAGDAVTFTQAMTLDASGRLGLGTSSPSIKLDIRTGARTIQLGVNPTSSSYGSALFLSGDVGSTEKAWKVGTYYTGGATALVFEYSTTDTSYSGNVSTLTYSEKMRISHDGCMLLGGTNNTGSRLHISGNLGSVRGNNPSSIRITNTDTGNYATISAGAVGVDNGGLEISTDGTRRFVISGAGNVLIPGVYNLTTGAAGNVHVASDGTMYRSTSSLKYKTDVQDATHGLEKVMALRPVTYKGNSDGELVFGGLIAEEVHDVGLTEFVQYADDGTPDALAYANMVSLAFKAIQEQQEIIESLKARLDAAGL